MPVVTSKEAPENLRPYLHHGVRLDWKEGVKDAISDCPWCGRTNKFSVKVDTGIWQCFVCQEGGSKGGGNATTFVRTLHRLSFDNTQLKDYHDFAISRSLSVSSLKSWEVSRSLTTNEWLIPGYNVDSNICNLYKYVPIKGSDGIYKNKLIPTPTLGHQLHGMNLYDNSKPIVDICEGPWDGMALWEAFSLTQINDNEEIEAYKAEGRKLINFRNVIAVPGTKTFFQPWVDKLAGKIVNIWYDNDHPRTENGRTIEPAGIEGIKKVASLLYQSKNPPQEVNYCHWGDKGYDLSLQNGYDVKDELRNVNA